MPKLQVGEDSETTLRPIGMAPGGEDPRSGLEGPHLPSLRDIVHQQAGTSQDIGSARDSGRVRDEADEFLRLDASRRGQSYSEYLREHGMLTEYDEKRIKRWEVPYNE